MTSPPDLPFDPWRDTKDTLHLYAQILGKVRLAATPRRNHWWNVTLYVSVRGFTTGLLQVDDTDFDLQLDVVEPALVGRNHKGVVVRLDLHDGLAVAEFWHGAHRVLGELGVAPRLDPHPFGVPMKTPFPEDTDHSTYDPAAVHRFWTVLRWNQAVFEEFAGWFYGKTSPVHLFWHSFDLAVGRFSGRRAPARPDADPVTAEAYSHEVISFGFWAGDTATPFPAYYSYTAPEPPGLADCALRPATAAWQPTPGDSHLAILPYENVRSTAVPRATLLEFLQSAYEAGATSAGWDVAELATPWCPVTEAGADLKGGPT